MSNIPLPTNYFVQSFTLLDQRRYGFDLDAGGCFAVPIFRSSL
jgi:hypothetical protein